MTRKDRLDPDAINNNLKTKRVGRKIMVYKSTSSTNDIAAEYAKNKNNDGLVIFAEEQTAGRGRAGTGWFSNPGDSILCSIVLTECGISGELLSLAVAVSAAEAVGKTASSNAKIKWPNDIILKGKKVAGILLESKRRSGRNIYILGIGINCHQKRIEFPEELRKTATSIDAENRTICDRISLAKRLLTSVDRWLEIAEKNGNRVTRRWCSMSLLLNQRVTVIYSGREFTGNCIGIDPEKGLVLQLDRGGVRMFDAAHTTIAR